MIIYNDKYDSILREWVEKFPRSYFKKVKAKANSHILNYVENCTPMLRDKYYLISTKIFWVLNKLQDFPKCKICDKPIKKNIKVTEGYPSHCSAQCLSNDPSVLEHKRLAYEKRYGDGITNPFQSREVISKIDKTNYERYGVRRFTQTKKYKSMILEQSSNILETKRKTYEKNSSYNESKPEQLAYNLLKRKYPDLIQHYTSNLYPFICDYYSPSNDLYIEFNGTWTHGGHHFNPNNPDDIKQLDDWKEKSNTNTSEKSYYLNAIYTWTDLDVRKLEISKQNNLNYMVFWNLYDIYEHVIPDYSNILKVKSLLIPYRRNTIDREFNFYKNAKCEVLDPYPPRKNEIIKYFQQDQLFKIERYIWEHDQVKRTKLIENRVKYLNKPVSELTHNDILNGFKRSGIYYGYSHFNPLWFKWFIQNYNIKTCYDPTGGWGDRVLGGLDLDLYVYNDLSKHTKEHVDEIVKFFHIKNVVTYCNDASTFVPKEKFESMFTCPPYYNLEKYECGGFKNLNEYILFINNLFKVFDTTPDCRIFGIVLREDLLVGHQDYSEKFEVNIRSSGQYLTKTPKTKSEYMYIYKK